MSETEAVDGGNGTIRSQSMYYGTMVGGTFLKVYVSLLLFYYLLFITIFRFTLFTFTH